MECTKEVVEITISPEHLLMAKDMGRNHHLLNNWNPILPNGRIKSCAIFCKEEDCTTLIEYAFKHFSPYEFTFETKEEGSKERLKIVKGIISRFGDYNSGSSSTRDDEYLGKTTRYIKYCFSK